MKNKAFYQSIPLPKFWFWAWYEDGHHFFQKFNYTNKPAGEKYSVMKCKEEDLTEENLAFMVKHNLSRK